VIPGLPEGTDLSAVTSMFEPFFATLATRRTLKLPGEVVETNGTKSEDGTSVTWSAGYDDLMNKGVLHRVAFRGEGIEWKPFHAQADFEALVRRIREATRAAAAEAPKPPVAPTTPPSGTPTPSAPPAPPAPSPEAPAPGSPPAMG
jgi:hypothetical protein